MEKEKNNKDYKKEFSNKRNKMIILNGIAAFIMPIFIIGYFILNYMYADLPSWAGNMGAGMIIFFVIYILYMWRCPKCGMPLGRGLSIKKCKFCGTRFYE